MTAGRIDEIKDRLWVTWETDDIGDDEYESLENELEKLAAESKDQECLFALSQLHLHKANACKRAAARYALQGLAIDPCHTGLHDDFNTANNGGGGDFNHRNHHRIIDHYYRFTGEHPDCFIARRILIENLIDNNRLEEAKLEIRKAREEAGSKAFYLDYYQGEVLQREGRWDEAVRKWEQAIADNPTNSACLFQYAEEHAKIRDYAVAKEYYRISFELQDRPRKVDALIATLQLLEMERDQRGALAIADEIIGVYKEDYGIVDGPEVQRYLEKRQQLLSPE